MDLMDRANDRRRMYMRDRIEHKLDDALRDNARLEQTNELLKQELERDDRERDQIWSAVQTGMRGRRRSGWFRRTLVLGAGVGAAYVWGAKAGRGRYEEIVSWFDRLRGRASMMQDDMQRSMSTKASEMTDQLAGKIQQGADKASDAIQQGASKTSDKVEEGGYKAAESVRSTSPSSSMPTSSTPTSSSSSSASRSSGSASSSSTPKG
jgi:cell division septum initiation protein DivIVA